MLPVMLIHRESGPTAIITGDMGTVHRELLAESSFRQEMRAIVEAGRGLPESSARRHHFVPAFALAQFADPVGERKGWLAQLDVRTGEAGRTRPNDAAFDIDLYTYEAKRGGRSQSVEVFLSIVEKHAAPALARLREDPAQMTPQDRETVSYFLALQESRTPSGLVRSERLRQVVFEVEAAFDLLSVETFRSAFKSDLVDSLSQQEAEEMRLRMQRQLLDGLVGFEAPRTGAMAQILQGLTEIAKEVYSLDWTVVKARDSEFITSDRPVAMVDRTPEFPWSGNAWNSSDGAITFYALSPTVGLFMVPGDCELSVAHSTAERTRRLNLMTYGWAERYVYGANQDTLLRVRDQAVGHPSEVARRRSFKYVMLMPDEYFDQSVAAEYERRGWPRRLPVEGAQGETRQMGYVVVDLDEPPGSAARKATEIARGFP